MTTITTQLAEALRDCVDLQRTIGIRDDETATMRNSLAALAAYDAQQPTTLSGSEKQGDHTPEPWRASTYTVVTNGETGDCVMVGDDTVADCYGGPQRSAANARRIVACVNLLAGIDTATLKRLYGNRGALAEYL